MSLVLAFSYCLKRKRKEKKMTTHEMRELCKKYSILMRGVFIFKHLILRSDFFKKFDYKVR